ncbi:hypothetical protein A8C32_17600 [Flavivirga aquatica]|uniref:Uncharacterized protein n=1 Tax=Flavivirga aquatica TaxID=1849968 RepID=A0A1E5T8B4_9FLAO|nr:hypothetical protein [Flavivirga aquatica]OEK07611.1 hypothetical protein A8C32_17600 [Flavivirga aquatica]
MNTFILEVSSIGYKKDLRLNVECSCEKSKPAKNFKELVELVKQAEEMLILNGYDEMGDRIHILRGIYYGTKWSLDYSVEKSTMRNIAFNIPYTTTTTPPDAREKLKCLEECKSDLFNSLYQSYEVFDTPYVAVDFGHLIIGLEARKSEVAKSIHIPSQGGTGLEICTWVGDLGGGVGKLSVDRIKNSKIRAKTLFSINGHSYGTMVNLEGDIASYIVGMDENNPSKIDNPTENFSTIHEALLDYFDCKWDNRTLYFLKMLGGKFDGNNNLINRAKVEEKITEHLDEFASWYLGLRMKDKDSGGLEEFNDALGHFEPLSEEVASIFVDGLLHVINKPKDMITARTNPDPKHRRKTSFEKNKERMERIKEKIKDLNPFD